MKLMLFLGSGVSMPSGIPGTKELTRRIIEKDYHSDSAQRYFPGPEPNPRFVAENWVVPIQRFLRYLKSRTDAYKSSRGLRDEGNYEEIYNLVLQLVFEEGNVMGNPAAEDFEREARRRACEILQSLPGGFVRKAYEELLERSLRFIEYVLCHELSLKGPVQGLGLLEGLADSPHVARSDIVTTNHDELIERLYQHAEHNTVSYIDGFGPPVGGVRTLTPEVFSEHSAKVRLVKLHGSLGWYWDPKTAEICSVPLGRERADFLEKNRDAGLPLFLVGTDNKTSRYPMGVYLEMWNQFQRMLREHDLMVISGYGWNDRGINSTLMAWLQRPDKRILLLHKKPDEVRESYSSMRWQFDELARTHRLEILQEWPSDIKLDRLLDEIHSLPPILPSQGSSPQDPIA